MRTFILSFFVFLFAVMASGFSFAQGGCECAKGNPCSSTCRCAQAGCGCSECSCK